MTRASWLLASDAALIAQCEVDTYRGSGPGGQHRNKTESAVRLRHGPSGLVAHGEERRSQAENKHRALVRLREQLAFARREGLDLDSWRPSPALTELLGGGTARLGEKTLASPPYLLAIGELLDVLAAHGAEVGETAARLGLGTGALSKLLTHDRRALAVANQLRRQRGLRPLR